MARSSCLLLVLQVNHQQELLLRIDPLRQNIQTNVLVEQCITVRLISLVTKNYYLAIDPVVLVQRDILTQNRKYRGQVY